MNCTPKVRQKTFGVQFFMKHSFEEKLNIVNQALNGVPQKALCHRYHLGQHYLENLMDRYRRYGESGLRRKGHNALSAAEKEELVREYQENGVTLRQICNDYEVSRTAFESWVVKVRLGGYEALYSTKRRGRPTKDAMARPKKKEPQTDLEKLQAENLRLRAENALLKKVKALVEEQEARARLNGQKPSMN